MIAKLVFSWILVCALLPKGGALAFPIALSQFKSITIQEPWPTRANLSNQIKPFVAMVCVATVDLPRPTDYRYLIVFSSVDMNRTTMTDPSK